MDIQDLYTRFLSSSGICIDSRKFKENQIFVALKGDRFDANDFVDVILQQQPSLIISNREHDSSLVVTVDDTLETLQELASYHRSQLSFPIIGITGTNGKTTTKELIHTVLSTKYKCAATVGNLNNHIGVPLTLLSIDQDCEMGIIEMGANHEGEIKALCRIAKPTHGIITNIDKAHLEGFGSLQGVVNAKRELYDYIESERGILFYDINSDRLRNLLPDITTNIAYGNDLVVQSVFPYLNVRAGDHIIRTQLSGAYNATNVACAIEVGLHFNIGMLEMSNAIASYAPTNNRSQVVQRSSNTIIVDCYNANPRSMRSSIDNILNTEHTNKVFILGDMLELGDYSHTEHQEIINYLELHTSSDTIVYLVGNEFGALDTEYEQYDSVDALRSSKPLSKFADSLILLKGSRGIELEKYLESV